MQKSYTVFKKNQFFLKKSAVLIFSLMAEAPDATLKRLLMVRRRFCFEEKRENDSK